MKDKRVIVILSVMGLCNASDIIEYNRRRRLGLPSAPLDIEYDNSSTD